MSFTPTTHQTVKPTVQVAQPLPTIASTMCFNAAKQRDPIQKIERDMTSFSTDIGHNGESLYNLETFCIVHRFENDKDEERRENKEKGCGDYTNAEICIIQDYNFYESYNNDDDWLFEEQYEPASIYDYPNEYTQMLDSGEMVDADWSCRMGPMSMGASVDGFGDDFGNEFAEDYEYDPTYDPADDTGAFSYNEASNDPQFGDDASPESLTEEFEAPAIKSNVNLSSQFAKATTPDAEQEPEAPAAEPVAIAPAPIAANNQSFQMSA